MVSMKTIPVCDADSLKDGEMSVVLIADALSRSRTFVLFHTLTRLAGKKSILEMERFCCPR